jgi:carbamate kinase
MYILFLVSFYLLVLLYKISQFQHPTKPIGLFYTEEQADKMRQEKGYTFMEDAGRGYRRVVPSPQPINITHVLHPP